MKSIQQKLKTLLFLLMLGFAFASCSSDDDAPTPPTPIATLSSISPNSGPKTTIVTIYGSNFGDNVDKVSVYFNEVEAIVQAVANTEIITIVPAKSFTGVVKIMVNGTELIGPEFNYIITDIQVSTFAGSTIGFADGTGTSAQFRRPYGITVDSQGNLYVTDNENSKIRKITPSGVVSTIAGSTYGFADGMGADAKFNLPREIAIDSQNNLYVADSYNQKIRKITPSGVVSTFAGSTYGFSDGTGASAQFKTPYGITVDGQDNLYVADTENYKIRKITPSGVVSTIAGSTQGFTDGTGANAQFDYPVGIAIDRQDNLYIADGYKIRKITSSGVVTTVAGSTDGSADGTGTNAQFAYLNGITLDSEGNLYAADYSNNRIRKITPSGVVTTIAGSTPGFSDGTGANAQFDGPSGITVDGQGTLYVVDLGNNKIRKITQE